MKVNKKTKTKTNNHCSHSAVCSPLKPAFSESGSPVLSANLEGRRRFLGGSLASTRQLHKLHLCLPSSLTSCTTPRPSTCTQRQTLLRCSLNSAAPLTLYLYASCTQTLHKVNTQGSTLSTKQRHTQTPNQTSPFALNIRFKRCSQKV